MLAMCLFEAWSLEVETVALPASIPFPSKEGRERGGGGPAGDVLGICIFLSAYGEKAIKILISDSGSRPNQVR